MGTVEPPQPGSTTLYRSGRKRRGGGGRRRLSWPKRILVVLLTLVVLFVAFAAGLYLWAGTQVHTVGALAGYEGRPAPGKGTDWLLVGSDSRSHLTARQREELHVGNDEGLNTDTIMVLHHGDSGPYLVSLPRDSYVPIPGHGKNKINAAYALGGPKLLTRTVEQATGLRMGHYAEVNFLGFTDLVNALHGVRICLPEPLHDKKSGADFDRGCRNMNGTQALAYVRARYSDPEGDLGRVKRQQRFLGAVADRMLGASVLLNPFRLVPVVDAGLSALTVDKGTGVWDLGRMGWSMKQIADGGGRSVTVPVAGSGQERPGAGDVLVWDEAGARRLFDALRADRPIPTSGTN
ncbi:LCP family protein [Streptomyces sp. NPDC050610]|uniref:LCP family protein n=1 Tax=Streptomyces sp. NPDC050610 TaxID=3157097 RepID=UPI00341E53E8